MVEQIPIVNAGYAMPVCSDGLRLVFTALVQLRCYISDSLILDRIEGPGDWYDGASIPRLFWRLIGHPLSREFRWASFWHDRLCSEACTWSQRRLADAVLLRLLEEESVAYWRRTAMWIAVRAYAWCWWSWRAWR